MTIESAKGEIRYSTASTDSHVVSALYIYLQGLVVALFGALLSVVIWWIPYGYKVQGFMLGFLVGSYLLGIVNSRVTKRFWSKVYRFSKFTVLVQGAILLFICMVVLSSVATVFIIQIADGPQIDPFYQIQLGVGATLISPPFYGLLARSVDSWKINLLD